MRLKLFSGSAMFVNTTILVAGVTMIFILVFSMLLLDQGPKSFQKISVNVESIDDKGGMLYIKAEGFP